MAAHCPRGPTLCSAGTERPVARAPQAGLRRPLDTILPVPDCEVGPITLNTPPSSCPHRQPDPGLAPYYARDRARSPVRHRAHRPTMSTFPVHIHGDAANSYRLVGHAAMRWCRDNRCYHDIELGDFQLRATCSSGGAEYSLADRLREHGVISGLEASTGHDEHAGRQRPNASLPGGTPRRRPGRQRAGAPELASARGLHPGGSWEVVETRLVLRAITGHALTVLPTQNGRPASAGPERPPTPTS